MDPRLNAFENFCQFQQTRTSSMGSRKKNVKYQDHYYYANDFSDSCEINPFPKQVFSKADFPVDLLSANLFCPLCGKLVSQSQKFSAYDSLTYSRRFLAHDNCLANQSHRLLNDCYDHIQHLQYQPLEKNPIGKQILISDRQFCLELSLTHPLSEHKFIKLVTKSRLNGGELTWQLKNEEDSSSYEPNIICFPFIDFTVRLIVSEIGNEAEKKIIQNYINLSKVKLSNCKYLLVKSDSLALLFNICNTAKEKDDIVSAMNYKYRYSSKLNVPIISLEYLSAVLNCENENENENLNQADSYCQSSIRNILSETQEKSSVISNLDMKSYYDQSNKISNESLSQNQQKFSDKGSIAQKQKIDLQKLISSNKLSSYVRNGAQSRTFQKFLDEVTTDQIQIIIRSLYEQFQDLILDDYANYMTQKLFKVSTPNQRLMILNKLYPSLPGLVKNKQGTHTIQAYLDTLTLPEELQLIVSSIQADFEQLCLNSISTHFIQKVIKTFPIELTIGFYTVANKNFVKFATDKNAMCVLKYMLRRVKQCEGLPKVAQIKKHFINSITLNTPLIIQDNYGNYVVQFCYQLFGEAKSSGITQMIIEKFVQFSLHRYSNSVVCKCINTYWVDRSYVTKLKDCLNSQGIIQMYRSKEGNKTLLDLMERNQNSQLREKIYNVLASIGESSKFYHERWDLQKGIKSGPVGYEFKTFTEADNMQRSKNHSTNQSAGGKKKKK